jgi:hypothetical protein
VHVFDTGIATVAGDGEYGRKGRLQTLIFAIFDRGFSLQIGFVGNELCFEQEGHAENRRALTKALANAFFFSKRVGHAVAPNG